MKKDKSKKRNTKKKRSNVLKSGQYKNYLLIALILIIGLIAFNSVFDKKLDLNGDNVAYYLLAKSINEGNGYRNIWHVDESYHTHYPVGYTIFLSIFMFFSSSIVFLKIINGLIFFAALIVLFLLFRIIISDELLAALIVITIALNSHLLRYSTILMSETLFLFLSILTLYFLIKLDPQKPFFKDKNIYFLILALTSSYYVRNIGISIMFGVFVYFLLQRDWKHIFIVFGGSVLLISPWMIRNKMIGSGGSYIKPLLMVNPYHPDMGNAGLWDIVTRFFSNLTRYISTEIPSACLPFFESEIYKSHALGYIIGIVLISVIIFGLWRLKKYKILFTAYFLSTFGIILLWPDVWTGIRFVIPLVPLFIFLLLFGLYELAQIILEKYQLKTKFGIWLVLIFTLFSLSTVGNLSNFAKKPYPPSWKNYIFLAKWTKQNTNADDVICCRKGPLFYFYSGRKTMKYKYTSNDKVLIKNLVDKEAAYVVVEQLGFGSTGKYLIPAIQKNAQRFQQVIHLKNPDTYLLKFNKRK